MKRPSNLSSGLFIAALCLFLWDQARGEDSVSQAEKAVSQHLLESAESGDAQAEYEYWDHESNTAHDTEMGDGSTVRTLEQQLPFAGRINATAGWDTTPESELTARAQNGDIKARICLARLDEDRQIQRATNAFGWLEKSANQGFPKAEYEVSLYLLGDSGWQIHSLDHAAGLKFLTRAAEHGWGAAQSELAELYLAGERVPPDPAQAVVWLQKAADQGRPRAQYLLAEQYANGNGEPRYETDTPVALLRKAAQKGDYLALQALGDRYRTGLGVPVDYVQAIHDYEAAWAMDDQQNQQQVWHIASQANDIFDAPERALAPHFVWSPDFAPFARFVNVYQSATGQKTADAMHQLGDWYATGHCVPRDLAEATRWYDLAASQGGASAAQQRDKLNATPAPNPK